jgi:hypothetical protein
MNSIERTCQLHSLFVVACSAVQHFRDGAANSDFLMVSSSSWPCYDFLSPPVASENRLPIENRAAQMRLDFADQSKKPFCLLRTG